MKLGLAIKSIHEQNLLRIHFGKDFFYTCTSHLSDRGFASPIIDEKAEAEKRKQEELAKEKEAVIKEYEESMKKKGKAVKKDSGSAKTAEEEQDDKVRPAPLCRSLLRLLVMASTLR